MKLQWKAAMSMLIGDRFVQTAAGWQDLVTGRMANVVVGRAPADVEARSRRLATALGTFVNGAPGMLDFGPVGVDGWFEASELSQAWPVPAQFSLRRLERRAVTLVSAIASAPEWHGMRHIRLVAPPGSGAAIAMQDIARALRRFGFVSLRADITLRGEIRKHLNHRHLVLLVPTPAAADLAAQWATHLAAASDRGHLMIERVRVDDKPQESTGSVTVHVERLDTASLNDAYSAESNSPPLAISDLAEAAAESDGWPGRFSAALQRLHAIDHDRLIARERAGTTSTSPVSGSWPFSVSLSTASLASSSVERRLLARADSCHRIGRAAASDRWLRAALEASRRRGGAANVVSALEAWVPRLVEAGRWHHAAAIATRALSDAIDPAGRASIARLAATAHLEAGNISRAATCIDTAVCIEQVTGQRSTEKSLAIRAAVRFWQGRWREGRAELESLSLDQGRAPSIALWRELLAWAADEQARSTCWNGEGTDDDVWAFAMRAFRAADSGISQQLDQALSARPSLRDDWGHAIAAQAWLDLGDEQAAIAEAQAHHLRPIRTRGLADAVVLSLLRAGGMAHADDVEWLERFVSRESARGLIRWGQGRSSVQMLHDVSRLLEIVQASEDESTGLRDVCAWTQAAAGAVACAIVTAPAGEVAAGDALAALGVDRAHARAWLDRSAAALEEGEALAQAHAPIRYGGATVGLVVATALPARARPLFAAVQAAAAVSGAMVRARLDAMAADARGDQLAREIIGTSPAIAAVRATAGRAALAPFPVVIEGESGTGKELVARALHRLGPRRDRVFAALNCAALSDELVEAELFGHARGAFTHAVNARAGLFEEAHQGTLFLDEVGDLSPRAQAKLLRVLQEGEIRRVGENESRVVDVRVVAATNRPLAALVAAGRFRDDLMFRLSVIRIQVPPLRERQSDVPALALAFWRAAAGRIGTRAVLGPDAIQWLSELPWPGNVRELQNAMAAIAVSAPATGRVGARLVRAALKGMATSTHEPDVDIQPLEQARRQVERRLVTAALAKHTGSRMAAAHALGLSRQGLSKAMRRLGLAHAGVA